MAQVIWTERATSDLIEVLEYIEREDRATTQVVAAEAVRQANDRLLFPESGALVLEIDSSEIREVLVKKTFRLIYRVEFEDIHILAFVRSSRLLGKNFFKNL